MKIYFCLLMSALISNNILRDSFVQRLKNIENISTGLNPINLEQIDSIIDSINDVSGEITSAQLGAAALLNIPYPTLGYNPIEPLKNSPINTTCFQFGQGTLGWYFMYGYIKDFAFTLILFRIEIGTPQTNHNFRIFNPADGCVYGIVGGLGTRNGPWSTIPHTVIRGNYSCGDNGQFMFNGIPESTSTVSNFNISGNNGTIIANIDWKDEEGRDKHIYATYSKQNEPIYQGPSGCFPCIEGQGSLYWSYTNMIVNANTDIGTGIGTGWFDHQWWGLGYPDNSENIVETTPVIRWFWLTLQLPNNLQYMIECILSDLPILKNTYPIESTKIYKGIASYGLLGQATIDSMININGQNFPTQFTIILENKTYILKASFGNSLVIMPGNTINWEGPADVLDGQGNIIASGFIEGCNLDTEYNLVVKTASMAGIQPKDYHLFYNEQTKLSEYDLIPKVSPMIENMKDYQHKHTCSVVWVIIVMLFCIILLIILIFIRNK